MNDGDTVCKGYFYRNLRKNGNYVHQILQRIFQLFKS